MNTNEKIAKWLGLETEKDPLTEHLRTRYKALEFVYIDFLHDRNQQKWIEDKLIELGYRIDYCFEEKGTHWEIIIAKEENANWYDLDYIDNTIYIGIKNESKDLAFIQAVEQLIDKEK